MDALDLDFEAAIKRHTNPPFVTYMLARTRYFDDSLEEAVQDGARQVVILGAGFDSRGYRFHDRLRRVRFFEIDYGPTQEHKKQRVKQILGSIPAQVRYIAMDFTKDDLLAQLRKGGYSDKEKTLFISEGVFSYLPESAVKEAFRFVGDHSASGSTIAFSYILSKHPDVNNPNSRFARMGEPFLFGFPGESATEFVKREGLEVVFDASSGDVLDKYLKRKTGTPPLPPLAHTQATMTGFCTARVATK